MNIKSIFHKKKRQADNPRPLHISGVGEVPITPEPDDAETAAQALLEIIIKEKRHHHKRKHKVPTQTDQTADNEAPHDAAYYHHLADRIRIAYSTSTQRALRFVSFVEQQLKKPDIPTTGTSSLQLLEAELYKRIDIIDREGGKLKERWQHCLAEVTIRLMDSSRLSDGNNLTGKETSNKKHTGK